jgi:hypothetical protein
LNRRLLGALTAAVLSTLALVPSARAAATVHRFNLEIGAGATQISAGNFNRELDFFNRAFLEPNGLEGFDHITYSFLFDVGARYFLRPNIALRAGVGQLRNQTKREYLPAIGEDVQLRFEILSLPVNVGADYYFTPYNQGDFQARAFVGGGLLHTVENRVLFQQTSRLVDPVASAAGTRLISWQRDSPGWYGEFGVHMFFALRYSVVLNAYYRSAKAENLVYTKTTSGAVDLADGKPYELDLSGLGARGALLIGF